MRALEQRRGQPPGRSDRQGIAGELVGATDGAREKLAQHHVDADQQGRQQDQRTSKPEAALREAAHLRFPQSEEPALSWSAR